MLWRQFYDPSSQFTMKSNGHYSIATFPRQWMMYAWNKSYIFIHINHPSFDFISAVHLFSYIHHSLIILTADRLAQLVEFGRTTVREVVFFSPWTIFTSWPSRKLDFRISHCPVTVEEVYEFLLCSTKTRDERQGFDSYGHPTCNCGRASWC